MNARQVHAVLAAGVHNPGLIVRWRRHPALLEAHGVDPAALDLDALWKFAGLSVKVRHNRLREAYPLTFRLLHVAGLEIEVFASYASFRAARGQGFAGTTEERSADLIAFLEGWLDPGDRNHALLWDVIRHEHAVATLARAAPPGTPGEGRVEERPGSPSWVPVVKGQVILHEMGCDPQSIEAILFDRSPDLDRVPLGSRYCCYWREGADPVIRVLSLDEFGYYTLELTDGVRPISGLSELMIGTPDPAPGFLHGLAQLASVGMLGFIPSGGGSGE